MPVPIYLNGRFLTQRVTGVQRSARETVAALDRLLRTTHDAASLSLLAPAGTQCDLALEAIGFRAAGRFTGQAWEQFDLPALARDGYLVNLANLAPLRVRHQAVVIHDAQVWDMPENFSFAFRSWYRFALPRLARRADLLLTVSRFSRDALARHGVDGASRMEILPNGADHVLRAAADDSVLVRAGLEPGRFVLCVGSLNRNKNLQLVLAAADGIAGLGLDIATVGGANPAVFGAAPPTPVSGLRALGYVNDAALRALYEHALCFVMPSRHEGFGLPAVEAMACGCPVVVSRLGALPEVCGDAALYCDADDPATLLAAVTRIAREDGLALRMAAAGRERAAAYTWDGVARRLLGLLEARTACALAA